MHRRRQRRRERGKRRFAKQDSRIWRRRERRRESNAIRQRGPAPIHAQVPPGYCRAVGEGNQEAEETPQACTAKEEEVSERSRALLKQYAIEARGGGVTPPTIEQLRTMILEDSPDGYDVFYATMRARLP